MRLTLGQAPITQPTYHCLGKIDSHAERQLIPSRETDSTNKEDEDLPIGQTRFSYTLQSTVGRNSKGQRILYNSSRQKWEKTREEIQTQQYIGRKRAPSTDAPGASPLKRTTSDLPEIPQGEITETSEIPQEEIAETSGFLQEPPTPTAFVTENTPGIFTPTPTITRQLPPPPPPQQQSKPIVTMATQTTTGPIGVIPDRFDGNPQKAEKFVADCEIYLASNSNLYSSDERKILFFIPLCEKGAEAFALSYYRKGAGHMGSYDDFIKAFKRHFISTASEDQARIDITNIKQTGKVSAYIEKFNLLKEQAKITEEQALRIPFVRGLNEKVFERLMQKNPLPETLDDMQKECRNIEKTQTIIRDIREGIWKHSSNKPAKDPEAMDVDQLQINRLQRPSMSRQELMNRGLCFECGKPGHRAAQCPETDNHPKQQQGYRPNYQGRGGRGNYQGFRGGYSGGRGTYQGFRGGFGRNREYTNFQNRTIRQTPTEPTEDSGDKLASIRAIMTGMDTKDKETVLEELIKEDF